MADYSFWALGESQLSISNGVVLDGVTQGDGTHLNGEFITLNSSSYEQIFVRDGGSDVTFDDNDGDQVLDGSQTFDGVSYADGVRVEAEYQITLRDPDTGIEYDVVALNFATTSPSYGTVEGLAFVDTFPPIGVALEVVSAGEGPGGSGQPALDNVDIAEPACFTPGTRIDTPAGPRLVETLRAGDRVSTWDNGPQRLDWVGRTHYAAPHLAALPEARPVIIRAHAFGPGQPCRDMRVSPQHRILISGPEVELMFGEVEVLAAAGHLINGRDILKDDASQSVTYIHLRCAAHEILISDGLPSESYTPGARSGLGCVSADRHPVPNVVPLHLSVRPVIKRFEAALRQPGL